MTAQPHPGGKRALHSFPLVSMERNKATFRNDEHDWPKQLVFERVDEKRLVITLTGGTKKEVFSFTRVPR